MDYPQPEHGLNGQQLGASGPGGKGAMAYPQPMNGLHPAYQAQWLPAQFAALNPYGAGGYYHAQPGPGVAPQQYMPGPPLPGPPGAHPELAPRGWGGMQIHEQRDARGGHSRGGPRNGYHRGGGRGGRGGPGGGGRGWGGARGGRGRGGRHGNGYHHGGGEGGGDAAEDLLWKIKRLPGGARVEDVAVQGLRYLDSRGLAGVMKDLGKANLAHRAFELFDLIRSLGPGHEYAALLDEFTFTSCISNCVSQQDLSRALGLVEEMRARGIERNVHTFSALMNVCIKCGQYKLALDVYREMKQEGCPANVVTYNTLIDVYGKSGQWEAALGVLEQMKREHVHPVTRTYNTLMIACNTSSQWQEALRVYEEMVSHGHEPNTTTYNALISAYSKAGDLARVLATFKEMVQKGCERSVITYSSLISACEKAGEWKLALQLFDEMQQEGCVPNVISYNSLITACAQGAQWEKAAEVFEQMQSAGCRPDVVTYTALIQAYERGRQWRRALQAFQEMRARGCAPDTIVYTAIIDTLWETGVAWAQRSAAQLYRQAVAEGLMRRHSHVCGDSVELNLHSTTAGVALLSLHAWLADLHDRVQHAQQAQRAASSAASSNGGVSCNGVGTEAGAGEAGAAQQQAQQAQQAQRAALPEHVCVVAGRGKSKESSHSVIKECVTALLRSLKAPFKESPDSTAYIGRLEATGQQVADWLSQNGQAILSAIVPPPPAAAGPEAGAAAANGGGGAHAPGAAAAGAGGATGARTGSDASSTVASADEQANNAEGARGGEAGSERSGSSGPSPAPVLSPQSTPRGARGGGSMEDSAGLKQELNTEARVGEAFNTIKFFEETHCLNLQVMSYTYLQQRPQLVAFACNVGEALALPDEAVYDGVLLLDRVASVPLKIGEGLLAVAVAACLQIAAKQSPLPEGSMAPSLADVCQVTGLPGELVMQVQANILTALGSDTSSLSALRCLKLYLERIGGGEAPQLQKGKAGRNPFRLLHETLMDSDFLNYRPSVVAAAVLYADRKSRGLAPYWPSALASLTGYTLTATPELAAAVSGAQRLYEKLQVPAALWNYQPSAPQPISTAPPAHPGTAANGSAGRGPSPTTPHGLPSSSPHSAPVGPGAAFLHHHLGGGGGPNGAGPAGHPHPHPHHLGSVSSAPIAAPIPVPGAAAAGLASSQNGHHSSHLAAAAAAAAHNHHAHHLSAGAGLDSGPHSLPQGAEYLLQLHDDPRGVACSL